MSVVQLDQFAPQPKDGSSPTPRKPARPNGRTGANSRMASQESSNRRSPAETSGRGTPILSARPGIQLGSSGDKDAPPPKIKLTNLTAPTPKVAAEKTPAVKRMIGPFLLDQRIGLGGMGVVYKATYTKNGAQVALKVLPLALMSNKQLVARFNREMAILKKLKHPRIVQFYGGGEHDGQLFYAMEFIDGGTLESLLREKGRLPWEQVIDYGIQICEALEYAHDHGIVHRDLKPANLFIGKDDKLRLGDFGIARDADATALTASGSTCGTSAYMAPEQITGKQAISGKTDLYALGCVLFEMLTGHPPFAAKTQMELMLRHVNENPPKLRGEVMDCPVFLEQVILQLLHKHPDLRPLDALMTQVTLEEVFDRVAQQTSMTQHVTSGAGSTAINLAQITDPAELKRLLGKKKKKRKATGPIWERGWFLAACLSLLIGGIAWSLLPMSEEKLFAKAVPLMQSDDPVQWQEAYDRYLKSLLERFPDGKHAVEAVTLRDKLDMHRTERGMETRMRLGQDPKQEAERLWLQAREYERFGDFVSAKEQYRAMLEILQGREQDRAYRNLAARQLSLLEANSSGRVDRKQIVNEALKRARENYAANKKHLAEETWRSIINLYESNADFTDEITEARAGRAGRLDEVPSSRASSSDR